MPTGESAQHLVAVGLERPRLLGPDVGRAVRDPVHQLTRPHVVMHDAAARPHPVERVGWDESGRQTVGRGLAAPADHAREARLAGPQQAIAHHRVDAVGADDRVEFFFGSAGEAQRTGVGVDARALDAGLDGIGGQRLAQVRVQIRALHLVERRAEAFQAGNLGGRLEQHATAFPAAADVVLGHRAEFLQARFQPQRTQHLDRIRTDLDARADLAKCLRLLKDGRLETRAAQRNGRDEPAQARAYDCDAQRAAHASAISAPTPRSLRAWRSRARAPSQVPWSVFASGFLRRPGRKV